MYIKILVKKMLGMAGAIFSSICYVIFVGAANYTTPFIIAGPLLLTPSVVLSAADHGDDGDDGDHGDHEDDDGEKEKKEKNKAKTKKVTVPAGKVMICHKAGPKKYIEITVDDSAQAAHLNHGDYLGVCGTLDNAPELEVIGCQNKGLGQEYLDNLITAIQLNKAAQEDDAEPADRGVVGGHFDLDTSTSMYPNGSGSTNKHEHEWDDKNDLTTIDFFNIAGSGFDFIDRTFPGDQKFIITVANAALSTGGALDVNGMRENVVDYQSLVKSMLAGDKPLTVFKIGVLSDHDREEGIERLTSFKLSFDINAIISGGLIPTNTGCVRDNTFGPAGEYRNGALLIQALNADAYTLHPTLGYAQSGLLWEATVFWHWDPSECFHDAGWQAVYDQCIVDGSCLSPSKKSDKAKTVAAPDKIYVCHKAGNSGKYVKIHISKSAACAHLGFVPDDAGDDTGVECVPKGHQLGGDVFLVDGLADCPGVDPLDGSDETTVTTNYQTAVEECIDPKKGGGYMGGAATGRLNWKQVIDE